MNQPVVRVGCVVVAALMTAFIFYGAEPSPDPLIVIVPPWDKVIHFLYYGTMAALLAHGTGRRWFWIALLLVPLVGAADEWNQARIPGRDSSVFDWIADVAGTITFVAVYWWTTGRNAVTGDG